jgi:hypothetical protein
MHPCGLAACWIVHSATSNQFPESRSSNRAAAAVAAAAGESLAVAHGQKYSLLLPLWTCTPGCAPRMPVYLLHAYVTPQGFDAGRGVQEPDAQRSPEDTVGDLMGDQETCWEHVEAFCKEHLGSDADQLKACILSVCIVHADIE